MIVTMARLLLLLAPLTLQHAIFLEPPSRATLPRLRPTCGLAHNYDESQLYCGGATAQHGAPNMGRCGICGDPWAGPHPHQAGGKSVKFFGFGPLKIFVQIFVKNI